MLRRRVNESKAYHEAGVSLPFTKEYCVQRIPEPLKNLVDQLGHLPGLGPKSAMRAAMTLLKWPDTEVRRLGKGLYELRDTLHLCSRCGALADSDPCPSAPMQSGMRASSALLRSGTAC